MFTYSSLPVCLDEYKWLTVSNKMNTLPSLIVSSSNWEVPGRLVWNGTLELLRKACLTVFVD
eukprot:5837305-Amphidinium_carterae.1